MTPRPTPELERETALLRHLRTQCDFAGVGRLAPRLLRELHAASAGPDRETALRLMVDATHHTAFTLRCLGHPAEAWVAAQRCREAAETLDDPVFVSLATLVKAMAANACGSYRRMLALATRSVDAIQPHLAKPGAL